MRATVSLCRNIIKLDLSSNKISSEGITILAEGIRAGTIVTNDGFNQISVKLIKTFFRFLVIRFSFMLCCVVSYCIVLYCIVLYCVVLYCIT